VTTEREGLIYFNEKEKAELASRIGLAQTLRGLDANELFAVWMLVGRAYGDAQFRRQEVPAQ